MSHHLSNGRNVAIALTSKELTGQIYVNVSSTCSSQIIAIYYS